MNNCELVLAQGALSIKDSQQAVNLLCSEEKIATHACMNQNCQHKAFVCDNQACQCQKIHEYCLKAKNSSLLKNIQSKKISVQSLETCINDRIQEIIDMLSTFRDEIIIQMKKQFEFFGLTDIEKVFLNEVNSGICDKINGVKVWEIILHSKKQRNQIIKAVEETRQTLQNDFKQSKQFFDKAIEKTKKKIQACDIKIQEYFLATKMNNPSEIRKLFVQETLTDQQQLGFFKESKVIKSIKQAKIIENFIGIVMIKSAKLLYRASENGFETKKFHQKCDGIPNTLVLVQNEYKMKIGGYTSIPWQSTQHDVYLQDVSVPSFLFSLTNQQKFRLKSKGKAVKHNMNLGPVFGYNDLKVCNKGNENYDSWGNINQNYKVVNSQYSEKQTCTRFCGNPDSCNFKLEQWEVWNLQFVQKDNEN